MPGPCPLPSWSSSQPWRLGWFPLRLPLEPRWEFEGKVGNGNFPTKGDYCLALCFVVVVVLKTALGQWRKEVLS